MAHQPGLVTTSPFLVIDDQALDNARKELNTLFVTLTLTPFRADSDLFAAETRRCWAIGYPNIPTIRRRPLWIVFSKFGISVSSCQIHCLSPLGIDTDFIEQ